MSKTIHKKAEPTKYTDEELECEFEEALRSVNEDRLAAIRIFSKTTTMLMSLCITILSLLALIGGGILVFQNVPLLMNMGISIASMESLRLLDFSWLFWAVDCLMTISCREEIYVSKNKY